jgi:hypothetical protein
MFLLTGGLFGGGSTASSGGLFGGTNTGKYKNKRITLEAYLALRTYITNKRILLELYFSEEAHVTEPLYMPTGN